jgi:hypothetical protein
MVTRPVILKIHGAVDRVELERDSYVITEDHYIDELEQKFWSERGVDIYPVSLEDYIAALRQRTDALPPA